MQLNSVKKEKKKRKKSISKLLFFIYLPIELNGFGQFICGSSRTELFLDC